MNPTFISAEIAKSMDIEQLYQKLQSTSNGLSTQEADSRLKTFGLNTIKEKTRSPFLQFFLYFWGPIPWMIEFAAILSAILHHWSNLIIILVLLLVNGLVGFFEEHQAGNAIDALKKKLALKSLVKRDGKWVEIEASQIAPGDIVRLRLGNIIPADVKLFDGDYLSVDQSTLTGESFPVSKKMGDVAYSGSVVKQGEMEALVIATGENTFFGKTAKLVEEAGTSSHFQQAVLQIGHYLIYVSLGLALVIVIAQFFRGDPFLTLVQFVLVLIVASIPVAMPAVLSVTMALGALRLSKMKAIVTKLESIEEMAGVDILCCDKTGTLTQNKLKLGEPIIFQNGSPDTLLTCGCLASKAENQDPIDLAVLNGFQKAELLQSFKQIKFTPFDPVIKRTEAVILAPEGNTFYVTKGAPQVILALCNPNPSLETEVIQSINTLAAKGYRTLGVASSGDDKKSWQFLGLLTLSDPIREDSKETISHAIEHGIQIKMLTGDNVAIAKEISHQLHIGERICKAQDLKTKRIEECDGFAEVFPEHKFEIIQSLQKDNHIVGMTGDGVNDSPALKQANVGIAVSGATDAARSAASLVLTQPGLSVIIHAIEEARRIFERMNSYAIYRITETIRIMLFMVSCILVYNFYPVTALMIILLALLNDIPIMTIVYDHTLLESHPVRWKMKRVLTISTVLGCVGVCSTFLLIFIAKQYLSLPLEELQSLIFLKLSIAGHQTLFVVRTKHGFYDKPYPSPILLTAILTTQVLAALIVGFGIFVASIPWSYILYLWLYTLVWMFIADGVKNALYHYLGRDSK
jgi:H+-transporting ATPase